MGISLDIITERQCPFDRADRPNCAGGCFGRAGSGSDEPTAQAV